MPCFERNACRPDATGPCFGKDDRHGRSFQRPTRVPVPGVGTGRGRIRDCLARVLNKMGRVALRFKAGPARNAAFRESARVARNRALVGELDPHFHFRVVVLDGVFSR